MRRPNATFATLVSLLCACSAGASSHSQSSPEVLDADGITAFDNVRDALAHEVQDLSSLSLVSVTVDSNTDPSVITGIVPPANPTCGPDGQSCDSRGSTPAILAGTYWMRGNPLPDYLLSFANSRWTTVNGTPYGFLATFAPGSFGWKEKSVAQGANAGDFTYVPEICRVPQGDPTILAIAHSKSTYDPSLFARPIAEDFAEMASDEANPSSQDAVSDDDMNSFLAGVWNAGQLDLDGAQTQQLLGAAHVYYEAKFSPDYTEASVIVFGLLTGPGAPVPLQVPVPEAVASFSFAPHMSDPDIYVRKSFIAGVSSTPNYYLLTRIVDAQGNPTPHYQDFLQCVQERSQGRILNVVLGGQ